MTIYLEIEVEATGTLTPTVPATMYKRNGDPGDPAEGGELEDFEVTYNGKPIKLTPEDLEKVREEFIEHYEEEAPEPSDEDESFRRYLDG